MRPPPATVAAYGTFAAGHLARPLGGAVLGHFGDRLGRKTMLIVSVLGVFAAMPEEQFFSWGWRVPFLLSSVLLGAGVFVRSQVSESPILPAALAKEAAEGTPVQRKVPIVEVLRRPRALICTMPPGAGFTPTTLASIYASSAQVIGPVVWYLAGMALVSTVFILLTRDSKDSDLETHQH